MDIDLGWVTAFILVLVTLYFSLRRPPSVITVTDLIYYPVKSCPGIHLKSALIDETGIKFDRMWAICDSTHAIVSLKTDPRLLDLIPELQLNKTGSIDTLILRYHSKEFRLQTSTPASGPTFPVTIFRHPRTVQSECPAVNSFLQEIFKEEYMLVRMVETVEPHEEFKTKYDTKINLAAALHLHIVAEESNLALNKALPEGKKEINIERFRGNIQVKGGQPFEEDTWAEIEISGVRMVGVKPVRRCRMPTLDMETKEYDESQEPNTTLKTLHSAEGLPMFGSWFIRLNNGCINVGDQIRVLRRKPFSNKATE